MAIIPWSVRVAWFMAPTDSTDIYPVTEPKWWKWWLRSVETIIEMEDIPAPRREEWMLVYVKADWKYYKLLQNLIDWIEFSGWWATWPTWPTWPWADPILMPTYTVTNKTTDRQLDCDSVWINELADVLWTLIDDIKYWVKWATGATWNTGETWATGATWNTGETWATGATWNTGETW